MLLPKFRPNVYLVSLNGGGLAVDVMPTEGISHEKSAWNDLDLWSDHSCGDRSDRIGRLAFVAVRAAYRQR